jgi:hypothetical protein
MDVLRVAPTIDVETDRLHGCTPLLARLMWLFSYGRCVTVNRRLQQVIVSTQWLWFWRGVRVIPFAKVSRIIYRAQALPSLSLWRYLSLDESGTSDSAFFLISLAIKGDAPENAWTEVALFTVWEQQPREPGLLDRLAGIRQNPYRTGDESSRAIVEILHDYLGVPISSH